jgi:hypothetical protein
LIFDQGELEVKNIFLAISVLVITGCSSAPPSIQEGPNAEVSYDGLHTVDNSIFKLAWADPEVDFSQYDKIMPGGAFLEFRSVKKKARSRATSSDTEFYIDENNRERLKEELTTIFREELAKSTRFTIVDTPGEDVLTIRGGLHDIVSFVPPEYIGRSEIYLSSVGQITLILEAVDSRSNEVIFRAVERRAAERQGAAMRSNTVTNWAEVRRLIRRWATTLREGLDAIPEA